MGGNFLTDVSDQPSINRDAEKHAGHRLGHRARVAQRLFAVGVGVPLEAQLTRCGDECTRDARETAANQRFEGTLECHGDSAYGRREAW